MRKIRTTFGDDAVTDRTEQKRFKKFCSRDLSLIDEARSGKPKVINNDDLKQLVETDSSTTCLELTEKFNVTDERIHLHFHQLGDTWKKQMGPH
ncbi:hypothetical protein Trydic_g3461 [Trypoxylus dichotomus]